MIITKESVTVGDILWINNPLVDSKNIGSRPFVVWGKGRSNTQVAMFEISCRKKYGSQYPFNEPITKSTTNGLKQNSHIKCDLLFIYCEYIIPPQVKKLGKLEPKYMKKIKERMENAFNAKRLFFADQSNNGRRIRA